MNGVGVSLFVEFLLNYEWSERPVCFVPQICSKCDKLSLEPACLCFIPEKSSAIVVLNPSINAGPGWSLMAFSF